MRARIFACLAAAIGLGAGSVARAETQGRFSLINAYSQMQPNEAIIDAMLVRLWLRSEQIGGRNLSFIVDARSDVPLKETEIRFNGRCRGSIVDDPTCRDGAVRNTSLGQLKHLAGVYDLYLMFGETAPMKTTVSIGRKTVYEAGLVTVDGLVIERGFSKSRAGGFAGLMPDPFTRMVNADYPVLGTYWAYQGFSKWFRLGATVQGYIGDEGDKTGLDRATIFNQNYLKLSSSLNLATFAQIDVVPGPEERLVYVDLTYRPSGRYRLRLNATRYRPVAFDLSPQLNNGELVDPGVLGTFRTFAGANNLPYIRPEVLPENKLTSAVTLGKVVAHYVTRNSITPYVSGEYRVRDIDSKSAILATFGAYTYDPYDTGITARLRLQYQSGFDNDAIRVGGWLEREVATNFTLGGGVEAAQVTYTGLTAIDTTYPKSASVYSAYGQARYDRPAGIGLFFEAQYNNQVRTRDSNEPGPLATIPFKRPSESASEMGAYAGISYRF